jgi:uncharacterized membrane protein YheB (UPF0754 family)
MVKPLSEQLADLSARAKSAEDAATQAKTETHDRIVARMEQVQTAATAATEKVDQDIKAVKNATDHHWASLRSKVATDADFLKTKVQEGERRIEAKRAENYAEVMEERASAAIDYAIASVEQAKLSVLDAIIARVDAQAT